VYVLRVFKYILSSFAVFLSNPVQAQAPQWVNNLAAHEGIDQHSELACLSLAVYYEARGESHRGKMAVAEVVMNRTRSKRFPSTICEVLFQRGQFSFIKGRHAPLKPTSTKSWTDAIEVSKKVINSSTNNKWLFFCDCKRKGYRIGGHVFY
jgi:spore germination cell wall hydrolase CwlJ-like protein